MNSYTRWPNLICMVEAFGSNLELGSLLIGLCIGLLAGLILDFLWWRLGGNKYEKRLEVFEHYHWGMLSLIILKMLLRVHSAFLFFAGTGICLIVAEFTQDHPFALRSNHESSSTIIGIALVVVMVLTWASG